MNVEDIIKSKLKLTELTPDIKLDIVEVDIRIREFCNLLEAESIPNPLNFTHANMVVDLVKSMEVADAPLKSMDMGDTSYTFDTAVKSSRIDTLLRDYEGDLLKYRRIRK